MSFFSKNDHVLGVSILWNPVSIQAKTNKKVHFEQKYILLVFGSGHIYIYTLSPRTLGPGTLGPGALGPGTLGAGAQGPGTLGPIGPHRYKT